MTLMSFLSSILVAQVWILNGAANGDDGHVDQAILQDNYGRHASLRALLLAAFQESVTVHATFVALVLRAPPVGPAPRALALLRGHSGMLLRRVADFVGVVRGRQLRNVREALHLLLLVIDAHACPCDRVEHAGKSTMRVFRVSGVIAASLSAMPL